MCGCALKPNPASTPARSIILAKPAVVNGVPRSEVKTKGDLGSCYCEPVEDNMTTDMYKRDQEIENNVVLMNMLYDHALVGWNPKAGPNDGNQRRLNRLFRSKSIMAWAELVRDAVCGKLGLQDAEDRARPFYRSLSADQLTGIASVIERLVNSRVWAAPAGDEVDSVLADNKSRVKEWLKTHGLSTGYLMGAPE
jgi:hypothetical protein